MTSITKEAKAAKAKPGQNFQCVIDRELLKSVMVKRERDNVTWRALLEAMFKRYLSER